MCYLTSPLTFEERGKEEPFVFRCLDWIRKAESSLDLLRIRPVFVFCEDTKECVELEGTGLGWIIVHAQTKLHCVVFF